MKGHSTLYPYRGDDRTVTNNCDLTPLLERLSEQDGTPLWVELLPAGRAISGRDGRCWINDKPEDIVAAFAAHGADLPIDVEHSTERKGPAGEPAPAMGWIKALEVRAGGAIWGLVEWTDQGRSIVGDKSYRYLSPVFLHETHSGRILKLLSAGLTNQPNLHLTALNRAAKSFSTQPKEADMAMSNVICRALGFGDDMTEDQAVAAIESLKDELATTRNQAENPTLEKFVPRADYDAAIERASQAEATLEKHETRAREAGIEHAIEHALESGKITPASVAYHTAQCRSAGGLERFKAYVAAAPVVAGASGLDGKRPEGVSALSDEDKSVCRMLRIPEDEFAKIKKEDS